MISHELSPLPYRTVQSTLYLLLLQRDASGPQNGHGRCDSRTSNPHCEVTTFTPLQKELKYLLKFYVNNSAAQEEAAADVSDSSNTESSDTVVTNKVSAPRTPQAQSFDFSTFIPGTRAEAVLLLKKSAEYFKINEPNSPIPFLVDRAIRMSSMSFMDLINDVEPNALNKVKEILGVKQSSDSSDD